MLNLVISRARRARGGEHGAVLVITALAMTVVLVIAAFVIDIAIWFVHGRHLQTEADAAALASAQLFQFPCTPNGTLDTAIANMAHEYDGTLAPPTGTFYNRQVNREPTPATVYSPISHNLFSLMNASQFKNQNVPNPADALTGSPCRDSAIDVKLTETNLPSFFPFINPSYINREAEVAIENLTAGKGITPLAEPLPTPSSMKAFLIDEGNGNAAITGGTVTLNPVPGTNNAQWTATTTSPVAFNSGITGPIGMEIATSNTSSITTCAAALNCYDTTDTPNIGVTFTRLWTAGAPSFPTTAPVLRDATIAPTLSGGCPGLPGSAFSNFVSTSVNCTVTLSANLQFGATATCTQAKGGAYTLTYGTATATLSPPAACSTGTASPNGIWTSGNITVGPSKGAIPMTLQFSVTSGPKTAYPFTTGGDNKGICTSGKSCTYNFPGTIQRVFSGAYNDESVSSSNSGPILAASIDDPTGNAIQSIQKGTSENVTINVTVESFQNSLSLPSAPLELAFGGNQANALVSCPGQSAGNPQAELAIWKGCNVGVALNTNFTAPFCNNGGTGTTNAAGDYICLPEIPGSKLDNVLDDAMQCKINGSTSASQCNPVAGCVNKNYWANNTVAGPNNTIAELLDEVPPDPRLLTLFTTDNGALNTGRGTQVPIRIITDFYVTGWAGDPCLTQSNGTSTITLKDGTTPTMYYTHDDAPSTGAGSDPTGVLLGHFVQFTVIGPGSGSGKCVQTGALGNCIGILTK